MVEQYRLENESVYEYDYDADAYIFIGNLNGESFDDFIEAYEHGES